MSLRKTGLVVLISGMVALGCASCSHTSAVLSARCRAVADDFGKLRMVIGSPSYCWGIDPVILDDLRKAGMEVLVWPDAPMFTPSTGHDMRDPMIYNVVIYGDTFYHLIQPDPNTGEMPDRIKNNVPALKRFLEAGGGIWFCGLGEQNWGESAYALNYILKELDLGAEVIDEVVMDTAVTNEGTRYGDVAWVDVMPDELTKGVENILHRHAAISGEGSMGIAPIVKLSPEWRILLKGKSTAASFPCDRTDHSGSLLPDARTVKSSPILCAVRQAGKGRVVLWPTWTVFNVTAGSGGPGDDYAEALIDGELDGKRSDGARLIENFLCWLAEPSQGSTEVGSFDPDKFEAAEEKVDVDKRLKEWASPGRRDYPNQYKGLIGAHSNLSDGASTPEEMIAAAKAAGYDFIAFTEDLAGMDEAKWKRLLAACDKAHQDDPNFMAYPGLEVIDEPGNRGVIFGNRYWVKDAWRSKKDPSRIQWWYKFAYEADADAHRWSPRVIIHSQTNNKRPWNTGLWSFLGAYCYKAGKLVDDSFHEWRLLGKRYAYFLNTGIMAVHTVSSADEIHAAAKEGLYQTYIRADNLQQVLSRLSGCVGPMGYFPSYISAGPEIRDFKAYAAVMGGEISFDLAHPDNDRGLLHILTRSDAGLKEVSVYNGEKLMRRFRPDGNSFETFMTIHADTCNVYSLSVTDNLGRSAVSWSAFLQIQERVHRRCGDNWNWMTTGKGAGTRTLPKFTQHLLEVTSAWRARDMTPESEKAPKRPRYKCTQTNYCHGGLDIAAFPIVWPNFMLVDGKLWDAWYPAMSLDFSAVGRYGSVLRNTVVADNAVRNAKPYSYGPFSGPYKVVPTPWPADFLGYAPMSKPDGMVIARCRGNVKFVREVSHVEGKPVKLRLGDRGPNLLLPGGSMGPPQAKTLEIMSPDGTSKIIHLEENQLITEDIPAGGYVCWYDADGDGVGGMISLTPGVQITYGPKEYHIELPVGPTDKYPAPPIKPGTEVNWDAIYITGTAATSNSSEQIRDVWEGMGIAGKPTLYSVDARVGKVLDQQFFLTLDSEDYGFSGQIVKTTGKPLPIHLPVMVKNLNPRWTAVVWYRGLTHLHTVDYYRDRWGHKSWRWRLATYEPRTDDIQPIPIIDDNVGYCQVDTDKQDSDVFIGNPIVCDQAEVFICVIKAEKGKCTFEINNPTDKELTCAVRPSKGFELTGQWKKTVTLSAGGYELVVVERH